MRSTSLGVLHRRAGDLANLSHNMMMPMDQTMRMQQ
jgi:hypothetical protein